MSTESCEFTKFNLGIRGDYKLVKVNGTVQDGEGYFLRLGKPQGGRWNKIWTKLFFGDHDVLKGDIVNGGKDSQGDLYEFVKFVEPWFRRASNDSRTILTSIKNLKRMKFSKNFDQLTIIATDPNSTLHFKRFVAKRPPYVTSELLA